ncbi:MAG: hypothetical protein M1831_000374 [Alyxoria varia]|nr:MAG: hypothetical protein M1831_000374 [Alyxoria varia]
MPLAHSLSKRLRSDSHQNVQPTRSFSSRSGKQVKMGEISLPMNLLSTTNILSYEAPDIAIAQQTRNVPPQYSYHRPSESHSAHSATSTEPALTDGSSAGSSPAVEHNHLSCYFPGPTVARTTSARKAVEVDENVPAIPQRAPSHSKREHERVARKRSQRSMTHSPNSSTPSSPTGDRNSFEIIGNPKSNSQMRSPSLAQTTRSVFSPPPHHHPFGSELEQLNEVAETFTDVARDMENDEDAMVMRQRGLEKYSVDDYISEIGYLFPTTMFQAGIGPEENDGGWI